MAGDLPPEYVLNQLKKGQLSPFYLFHGQEQFLLERTLNRVREDFIPESARDLNTHIFYGGKAESGEKVDPAEIIGTARSLPFMSPNRLIIVRRTDNFPATALETFVPYFESPVETTCLIFVASKPDFRKKFYRNIRQLGSAVSFRKLYDNQVVPWIKDTAKELGLNIEIRACEYLYELVGNQLIDLYSELEKLHLRYGNTTVGIEEAKKLAIYSRRYTIFELVDEVSFKRGAEALSVLNRFVEEEGEDGILRILGMLTRQIGLLWQTKTIIQGGGRMSDVSRKLRVQDFVAKKLVPQARHWSTDDFEHALHLLYQADGLLKSGSPGNLVLENVVLSICDKNKRIAEFRD